MSYVSLGKVGSLSKWQLEQFMNRVALISSVSFSTQGGDLITDFHIGSSRLSVLYSQETSMAYFLFRSKAQRLDVITQDWHRLTEGLRLRISLEKTSDPSLLEIGHEYVYVNEDIYFNLEVW